jgi:crotonobetainyl-CoA:carnitine CoA-transferase CaiB-like acyl-CoA transferase
LEQLTKKRTGPLSGVKVIELCAFMAGPTCGLMLADLGADVIKVERVPGGDDTRRFVSSTVGGHNASFMVMNRNKRGVAIDLKSDDGLQVFRRIVASADIVIENFRPGTFEKMGISYETLSKDNPGLIYGAISGFGRTGPLGDRAGLDLIAQGFSGLMSFTGEGPGRPPVKVGAPVSDTTSGMLLALGVTAAYANRLKTGKGQFVETSLLEAALSHTYWQAATYLADGEVAEPLGSAHPLTSPYQAYKCSDGYIVIGAPNQLNWTRLCEALEAPYLLADARFADPKLRKRNNDELTPVLEAVFGGQTRATWIERIEAKGVPCGPVHSIGEALDHPHVRARDMVVTVDCGAAGEVQTVGCPIKFSRTPSSIDKAPPHYGEDTAEVLREVGFTAAEIEHLRRQGAIHMANAAPAQEVA